MELLSICKKGWLMNAMENFYIQKFQQEGTFIQEQNSGEENSPL
jgi:hypothetical protein